MSRRHWTRFRAPLAGAFGLVMFLLLWELLVAAFDVKPYVLRAPSAILAELADTPGVYARAALVTGWHALVGLAIALAAALVLGTLLAASRFAEEAAAPVLTLVLVTPWVAYISSVVLWLGAGTRPVLFVVAFVSLPAFTFAMVTGLRSADPAAQELLRSVDASAGEILWRLRLPSALPTLMSTARYSLGLALAAAYFAEGAALSNQGLGAIGRRAQAFNEGDPLWASILCTALLGALGLALITVAERILLRWHASQRRLGP